MMARKAGGRGGGARRAGYAGSADYQER